MLRFAKILTTTLIQGIDFNTVKNDRVQIQRSENTTLEKDFNMLKNEKVQIPWVGKTPSQLDSNPYQMIQVQIQMIAKP